MCISPRAASVPRLPRLLLCLRYPGKQAWNMIGE
jgi:hypothetical protein